VPGRLPEVFGAAGHHRPAARTEPPRR